MGSILFLDMLYFFSLGFYYTNYPLDREHCIYHCAKKILDTIIRESDIEEKLIKASIYLRKSILNRSWKMSLSFGF